MLSSSRARLCLPGQAVNWLRACSSVAAEPKQSGLAICWLQVRAQLQRPQQSCFSTHCSREVVCYSLH